MTMYLRVPFSEFARPVLRPIQVEAGKDYRTLGVKWRGEGAYERHTFDGSRIRAEKLSVVRTGDLTFNKIWVRHGSSGIIPPEMDGCVASSDFPTFELDESKVDRSWLLYLFKTKWFWEECDLKSRGTSGKNRIRPEQFLQVEIPFPPLHEQQRIVGRIEELARRVEEARGLRREAGGETGVLLGVAVGRIFNELPREEHAPLARLATKIGSGSTPKGGRSIYPSSGIPLIRSQNVRMREFQ
jgi:type I restriction enzyme S subunit